MGFDESCVFGWHEGPRYHEPYIYENGEIKTGVKDKYGPNVYVEHLIDFIKKNKDDRFLAYYSMSLPHEISNDMKTPPPFGAKGRYETYKDFFPFYLREHSKKNTRILHYIGTIGYQALLWSLIVTQNYYFIPLILIAGYGPAWVAHFFIEKNKPATFKYPLYSFIGDWVMLKDIILGKVMNISHSPTLPSLSVFNKLIWIKTIYL